MLSGDARRRKHLREVFSHIWVLSSAFEVPKHLRRKLTSCVDLAAFRSDAEALGDALVEVAPVGLLAVRIDSPR